jgi:hypothetical protein
LHLSDNKIRIFRYVTKRKLKNLTVYFTVLIFDSTAGKYSM